MRSRSTNEDPLTILLPLQHRAWGKSEFAPDLCGYGNLTLSCQFGGGEGHISHYHGNGQAQCVVVPAEAALFAIAVSRNRRPRNGSD